MLTYREWRQLNESFGGPVPIGLGTPSVVGGMLGAQVNQTTARAQELEEAAKKSKKKMLGDVEPEEDAEDVEEPKEKEGEEEEEEGEEEGKDKEPEEKEEEPEDKKPLFMSKKKSKKKMAKEQKEWENSVLGQLNSDPNHKFWDGFSEIKEDSLLPPTDPNNGLEQKEAPLPGQVGYAPVPRVGGDWFSNG